ncbi:hypothetical protein BDF14DRAFT_1761655 [Spinellus fusiger]|nr:hypothetical protein BDF14DRAFT_1761655 [Spinellus fusiger]
MSDLTTLSQRYQALRTQPGQSTGAEYSEAVDSPQGEKYQTMQALGDQLGLPGTLAADILLHLGKPDELTPVTLYDSTTSDATTQPYYLVYYWRPKQDYLYFKVDPLHEKVITSDWHLSKD